VTAVLTLLSCAGLTFVLKYGSILNLVRAFLCKFKIFDELFKCSLCLGFWSGLAHTVFLYHFEWNNIYLLIPFASACTCWFADCIITNIQTIEMLMDKKIEKE